MDLIQLVLIHRHGQRTPLYPEYSETLYPYGNIWQQCYLSPFLHSFYKSLEPNSLPEIHSPDHPAHEFPPSFVPQVHKKVNIKDLDAYKHLQQMFSTPNGTCFYGQLTDAGKRNMMSIGSQLRKLYVDKLGLLSVELNPLDLYIRSTDYSRTIESVQYLLAGLYPYSTRNGSPDLNIHIRQFSDETMAPHNVSCPSLLLDTKILRDKLLTKTLPEAKKAFDSIRHLGLKNSSELNLHAVHRVYDFFACLNGHGISFPIGLHRRVLTDFESLAVKQWCHIYEDESIAKRAIGRFLPEIKEKIMDAVHSINNPVKLAIFSGHDSTISPLLSAFKVFPGEYPDFGSHISLQVYKSQKGEKQHYIRMLYNGESVKVPACQSPGNHYQGDPTLCTLEAFIHRMDQMTPVDFEKDCRSNIIISNDWDD